GLAIGSANAHYSGRTSIGDGPASELSKVVLRYCPDVDSAVNFIRKYRITDDGNHYAMVDISGKAAAVEKGPGDLFNVRWADSTGFVFVTNTSPDSNLRARCTSDQDYFINSDNRYVNLQRLFSDSNFIFAEAESIIFNHDSIGAICQHGDRYPGQLYTTRTRMMLPQEGRLLVAAKTSPEQQTWRPCECGWIEDTLTIVISDVKLHRARLPERCRLAQNYPNPFNIRTTISYELIENAQVEITIYNLMGEKVKTLIKQFQSEGEHSIIWDGRDEPGRDVASGTYYYQLKANDFVLTKRMILLK
ncbi:MAG TPA: T9SS type A sorting domain-containing protein, partial [bacterium]